MYGAFKVGDTTVADPEFDYLEKALQKFDDGPFFLGQFSLVDIAYAPLIERFDLVFADVWKYDFTAGRPKLAKWWEELNKIEAYKETKTDPEYLLAYFKNQFVVCYCLKNTLVYIFLKRKRLYEQEIEKLGNFQLRVHDQSRCQLSFLIGEIRSEAAIIRRNDGVWVEFDRLPGELPDVEEESEGGDGVERVGLGAHESVVDDDDPL